MSPECTRIYEFLPKALPPALQCPYLARWHTLSKTSVLSTKYDPVEIKNTISEKQIICETVYYKYIQLVSMLTVPQYYKLYNINSIHQYMFVANVWSLGI